VEPTAQGSDLAEPRDERRINCVGFRTKQLEANALIQAGLITLTRYSRPRKCSAKDSLIGGVALQADVEVNRATIL